MVMLDLSPGGRTLSDTAWVWTNSDMDILDVKVPTITAPVKPGRNLAVIIEVDGMNQPPQEDGLQFSARHRVHQQIGEATLTGLWGICDAGPDGAAEMTSGLRGDSPGTGSQSV